MRIQVCFNHLVFFFPPQQRQGTGATNGKEKTSAENGKGRLYFLMTIIKLNLQKVLFTVMIDIR